MRSFIGWLRYLFGRLFPSSSSTMVRTEIWVNGRKVEGEEATKVARKLDGLIKQINKEIDEAFK